MSSAEPFEVVVEPDGSIRVPADQVARLGLRPGEHLRLVRGAERAGPASQCPGSRPR